MEDDEEIKQPHARKRKAPESDIVVLNVGGTRFETRRSTLTSLGTGTTLGAMFSGKMMADPQEDGSFFFDRHPGGFEYVLEYYRSGIMPTVSSMQFEKEIDKLMWKKNLEFWSLSERQPEARVDVTVELNEAHESTSKLIMDRFSASTYYKSAVASGKDVFTLAFPSGIPFVRDTLRLPIHMTRDMSGDPTYVNPMIIDCFYFLSKNAEYFKEYVVRTHTLEVEIRIFKSIPKSNILRCWPLCDEQGAHSILHDHKPCVSVKLKRT